jgi:hypothetical protein
MLAINYMQNRYILFKNWKRFYNPGVKIYILASAAADAKVSSYLSSLFHALCCNVFKTGKLGIIIIITTTLKKRSSVSCRHLFQPNQHLTSCLLSHASNINYLT